MMTIKREEEEDEREGLICGTSHGGGGMAAAAVMVVEYLYSSMSKDLLGKFPDNSAFDFDYTQSTIWSPLVPHHFPSPSFSSSSTANALQRKLSYDDDDKKDHEETGVEGGSDGFWENHATAEVTWLKKLKENIKNKISTSCVFNHFGQINHRIKKKGKKGMKKKKKKKAFDGFSPIPSSSSAAGAAKSVYDSTTPRKVTCGSSQSAHTAAVAVSCAERGLKSHLLLQGEQPQILTGYNLISMLYGNVTYVPRSMYAKREEMLAKHAGSLADGCGSIISLDNLLEYSFSNYASIKSNFEQLDDRLSENVKKIVIVSEGAGDAVALLGVIRLVQYLSQTHLLGKQQSLNIVVDAGTGTTAVGLAIGALCLGLPWEITALMLAENIDGYKEQEKCLVSEFCRCSSMPLINQILNGVDGGIVHFVERDRPRKFGNVLEGEVESCQQIAQQTGVLVDPIYTLAAWELATQLSLEEREGGAKVVMIHTGGTLGMFGIAQRYGLTSLKPHLPQSIAGI